MDTFVILTPDFTVGLDKYIEKSCYKNTVIPINVQDLKRQITDRMYKVRYLFVTFNAIEEITELRELVEYLVEKHIKYCSLLPCDSSHRYVAANWNKPSDFYMPESLFLGSMLAIRDICCYKNSVMLSENYPLKSFLMLDELYMHDEDIHLHYTAHWRMRQLKEYALNPMKDTGTCCG